jgi:hypothetical protein
VLNSQVVYSQIVYSQIVYICNIPYCSICSDKDDAGNKDDEEKGDGDGDGDGEGDGDGDGTAEEEAAGKVDGEENVDKTDETDEAAKATCAFTYCYIVFLLCYIIFFFSSCPNLGGRRQGLVTHHIVSVTGQKSPPQEARGKPRLLLNPA